MLGWVDGADCFDRKFRQEVLQGSSSLNEETRKRLLCRHFSYSGGGIWTPIPDARLRLSEIIQLW
jgi:hypothetical protein